MCHGRPHITIRRMTNKLQHRRCCQWCTIILLIAWIVTELVRAQGSTNSDTTTVDTTVDTTDQTTSTSTSTAPNRRLLFQPTSTSFTTTNSTTGGLVDWSLSTPFPSHTTIPSINPFPFHIALQALESPQRFNFEVVPAVRAGAQVVGFDWIRNRTIGVVDAHQQISWSEVLPSWLQFISPATTDGRIFTLVLTAPQSGDHATIYTSPSPVILQFRAVLQYQCSAPPQPEEDDAAEENTSPADSTNLASSATTSSSSTSTPSASPPLVLIEEVQSFSILISLSIMPSFTSRVSDLSASYTLTSTPNLLEARNLLTNRRASAPATKGLTTYRMDWRDEVVYNCNDTTGAECDVCTVDTSSTSTPSSTPFCAFPAGSFFNAQAGTLRVRNPISILGNLQINSGATLEINHASPATSSTTTSTLSMTVSVIDCRDQLGKAQSIINEGLLVVRKGHLIVYSGMVGSGSIEVHPGGSIEFISLLPPPAIYYFNHTTLQTASNNLGGISMDQMNQRTSARALLAHISSSTGVANSSLVIGSSSSSTEVAATSSNLTNATTLTGANSTVSLSTNLNAGATNFTASSTGVDISSAISAGSSSGVTTNSSHFTNATIPLDTNSSSPTNSSDPSTTFDTSAANTTTSSTNSSDATVNSSSTGPTDVLSSSTGSSSDDTTSDYSTADPIAFNASASSTGSTTSSYSSIGSSTGSSYTPPPPPPVIPTHSVFSPHPSTILVSYGGAILFRYGQFVFRSLFQSSLYEQGQDASSSGVVQTGLNRFVILPYAHVIFDAVRNETNNPSVTSLRLDHILSYAQFHNLGWMSVWNTTLNMTSILFFKSYGLLNFTQPSRVYLDMSDNLAWNRLDGWNGYRGVSLTEDERKALKEVANLLTTTSDSPLIDSTTNDTSSTSSSSASPSSPSSSLASLVTALGPTSQTSLVSHPSNGGVGLVLNGLLYFISGKMLFSGGILASKFSHLFMKKGVEWQLEMVDMADITMSSTSTAASFLHFSGIEFSLDGIFTLKKGSMVLQTPLLQIEGHGQLIAQGLESRIKIDNHKINREIYLSMMTGETSALAPDSTTLVENPDALNDTNADLYSVNHTVTTSTMIAPPSYRECLIAPCLFVSNCQSFLISGGAALSLAPLTFLHFLPRAGVTIETLLLEGGSLILDSQVNYVGNRLIQNSTDPAALVNGFATLTAGVYIGNNSLISITDGSVAVASTSSPSATSFEFQPATCLFAFGNFSGSGRLDCQSRTIALDAVLLYPSFHSPSPFSLSVDQTTVLLSSINSTLPAPSLQFGSDLSMTERTVTVLDIFGFHSIGSIQAFGSTTLGGTLILNGSLHRWPFMTTTGRNATSAATDLMPTTPNNLDTITSRPASSDATVNNSSSINNPPSSSNATNSTTPLDVDSLLLFSSSFGLLPFSPSTSTNFVPPAHFSSIRLSSLYEILPLGWTLDMEYSRMKLFMNGTNSIVSVPSNTSMSGGIEVETALWLKAYAHDYQLNHTRTSTNQTSQANSNHLYPLFTLLLTLLLLSFLQHHQTYE